MAVVSPADGTAMLAFRSLSERSMLVVLCVLQLSCGSPATTGSLAVTVLQGVGRSPVGGAAVSLRATLTGAQTNANGKAEFRNLIPGVYTIRVALAGSCSAEQAATVSPGAATTMTVLLCGDGVSLANASEPAVVMADIASQDEQGVVTCENDWLKTGVGGADLGTNAVPLGGCHGAMAVLTEQHGLYFSDDAGAMPWTTALGDMQNVTLPPLVRVPMTVFVSQSVVDQEAASALIDGAQIANARTVLARSFAGLELAGTESGGAIAITKASAAQSAVIGVGCGNVGLIKAQADLYQSNRLNVYVVLEIDPGVGSSAGRTCITDDAPNIIFLSTALNTNTLAHEIGHALGLVRPQSGHTIALEGFYRDGSESLNVMYPASLGSPQDFSVGQVFRMTYASESWLNLPSGANNKTSRDRQLAFSVAQVTACGCPHTLALPSCPALNTDIVRTGTLVTTTGSLQACGANITPPATLTCAASKTVIATLLPAGAFGAPEWRAVNPEIVTVVPGASTASTKQAVLTGIANGVGSVVFFAGGSPVRFDVHVSGC